MDCMVDAMFAVEIFIEAWRYIVTFVATSKGASVWRKDLLLKSFNTPTTGHFIKPPIMLISLFNMSFGFLIPKLFTNDSFTKNSTVGPEGFKFLPAISCN